MGCSNELSIETPVLLRRIKINGTLTSSDLAKLKESISLFEELLFKFIDATAKND